MEFRECPFCGGKNITFDKCTKRVRCKGCFATGGLITPYLITGISENEAAAKAWNTRSYDEDIGKRKTGDS